MNLHGPTTMRDDEYLAALEYLLENPKRLIVTHVLPPGNTERPILRTRQLRNRLVQVWGLGRDIEAYDPLNQRVYLRPAIASLTPPILYGPGEGVEVVETTDSDGVRYIELWRIRQ